MRSSAGGGRDYRDSRESDDLASWLGATDAVTHSSCVLVLLYVLGAELKNG